MELSVSGHHARASPLLGVHRAAKGKVNLQQAVTPGVKQLQETRAGFSTVIGETCDYHHMRECPTQRHSRNFHM